MSKANEPTSSSGVAAESIVAATGEDQALLMSRQRRNLLKGILKEPNEEESTEV